MRIVLCALILLIGWVSMKVLAGLKQPPSETKIEKQTINVIAMTVEAQDYPIVISGYGEVKALTVVTLSSEVSGRIKKTHPSLRAGNIIPTGEIMFQIDPADYEAGLQEAQAGVSQWENTVARLEKQLAIDTQRLKTLERNAQLAKNEFERTKRLYETNRVGTRSGVDQAERAYNSTSDQADQMGQAVSLYPLQIRETESRLLSAKARLTIAETNLSRCTVKAPFDARVKSVALETGQFVSPGQNLLTLADDTVLEIQVPLDSKNARKWLQFEIPDTHQPYTAWFAKLTPVPCSIRWTEDKAGARWTGTLNRVVKFDEQTRTLIVAIRIPATSAMETNGRTLPLVEGMFCLIDIPGHTLQHVFRLPRHTVSFENEIYLVNDDNMLKTVAVSVERIQGEHVFVSKGLHKGDRVILTRLINPLENSLLKIIDPATVKEPTL